MTPYEQAHGAAKFELLCNLTYLSILSLPSILKTAFLTLTLPLGPFVMNAQRSLEQLHLSH